MLKTIEFPDSRLALQLLYRDNDLIDWPDSFVSFPFQSEKVERLYGPLIFPDPPRDRPYLVGCLVASMDGRIGFETVRGSRVMVRSNSLDVSGGLVDLWILNLVRAWSDGVLLGSSTLRDEPTFTGHVHDPDLMAFRKAHLTRFSPVPWNVLVTRDPVSIPQNHPVLTSPEIPVILVVPENRRTEVSPPASNHWQCLTFSDQDFPNPVKILASLRQMGIRQLAVESPYWIWRFMEARVLDEIFMNYTGVYAGGEQVPGSSTCFFPEKAPVVRMASLHLHGGSVLLTRQILVQEPEDR